MKPHILNVEPDGYSSKANYILEKIGKIQNGPFTRSELMQVLNDVDVMIVRLAHRIDKEILENAPELKVISTATTGLNHIDVKECSKRNIKVLSLKGETEFLDSIQATAEHTWALLLGLIRSLPHAHQHVIEGYWNRDAFKGTELFGKEIGIIGYGRIGKKVAAYGKVFGMQVLVYEKREDITKPDDVEFVSLTELLKRSDVISLHIDHNEENHAFIGEKEISQMKEHVVLINTSRGEILDEAALLDALKDQKMGGAALDVLIGENSWWDYSKPIIEYAANHQNLVISPHIGGCTYESMSATEIFMAQKLKNYLDSVNKYIQH